MNTDVVFGIDALLQDQLTRLAAKEPIGWVSGVGGGCIPMVYQRFEMHVIGICIAHMHHRNMLIQCDPKHQI